MRRALGRWRDRLADTNLKEYGAHSVVKRLRCRLLRQAFDLYVAGTKYRRKLMIEE